MSPHEKALAAKLAAQLAATFADRGSFAGASVRRASLHLRKGAPVKNNRLPTAPPGVVIELPSSQEGKRLAYVHISVRDGKLFLGNYLLDQVRGRWRIGPTWTDRFVIPAQVLVAIHFGRNVPEEFVQQITDMY